MASFWSCDQRGTSWYRMTKLPFSSDSRIWVDMAVLYPGLVSSPHLLSHTQDVIGAPRGKWGGPCSCYTITTYYWHSSYTFSSPREGTNSTGSLRTSDIIFFWCKWWNERRIYSGLMWQCKHDNCSKSSFCSPSPKLQQLPVPSTHQ